MSKGYVSSINPGNVALRFIDERLLDDYYRGDISSQHNRYTMRKVAAILAIFDKYAPNKGLMAVRTTDISKRPGNTPEEAIFAQFCDECKLAVGIGTQDAMRKNLFVDFHRMGLIVRYGPSEIPTDPLSSQRVKYASLSDQGLRLIQAEAIDEQFYIFSRGIDRLLGGFINILLRLLRDPDFKLKRIEIHEFMFFASAIGAHTSFNIDSERCVELIESYRNLSRMQRRAVIETLKAKLKPENYQGDKTSKRDFHNWRNKAEQIFYILDQTVYFDVRAKTLYLQREKVRSLSQKLQYFKQHRVDRSPGFELHHVVPLAWSESKEQFKLFDNWENMVYISAFEHAQITQNRNRNVVMTADDENIVLSDYSDNQVYLTNRETILYDSRNQPIMLEYNRQLLETVD